MFYNYWGKASKESVPVQSYHLLIYHCLDVAAVGAVFLRKNRRLSKHIASYLEMDEADVHAWIIFFLAIHDIGKFSESFQMLVPELRLKLHGVKGKRSYSERHDSLGYILWTELWNRFKKEGGFGMPPKSRELRQVRETLEIWAGCFAGHHGVPPHSVSGKKTLRCKTFFSGEDVDAAYEYVKTISQFMIPHPENVLPLFCKEEFRDRLKNISWCFAGLAILCDWVGSNSEYFKFNSMLRSEMSIEMYWSKIALPSAEVALENSGVLPEKTSLFTGINTLFDYVAVPTPLQQLCCDYKMFEEPQLWILEDVTGSGKTEAAVILLHRLMNLGLGQAFYIGLPTMATANAMYGRMAKTYRKLFDTGSNPSLVLAHGARHLSENFSNSIMPHENNERAYGESEENASAQCSAWIADHRKKSLLADVGIGTIDQVLLGVLPARHQALRLLGMASKILVVDEVHSYDPYMNALLKTLLQYHASLGGSALLLSATLPKAMREDLVNAYQTGLAGDSMFSASKTNYPLITLAGKNRFSELPVGTREEKFRSVDVKFVCDEKEIDKLIIEKSMAGECVCWIRNTVRDAREVFFRLSNHPEIEKNQVMLFHSRFALQERLNVESRVLDIFGDTSGSEKRAGKILIATQVVEQSLDLDFDFMISDLAPIDLLIQRIGRLQRHTRDSAGNILKGTGVKDGRKPPVLYLFGPEPEDSPTKEWFSSFFPVGSMVYPHVGQLWLTARLLKKKGTIVIPDGARELIEGVYGWDGEPIPEALEYDSCNVEGEEYAKRSQASFNTLILERGYDLQSGRWDEEDKISTRLGDETHDVYLAIDDEGELKPWGVGSFCWDMSRVRISAAKISRISDEMPSDLLKRIEDLKQNEKGLNRYSIVLPLFRYQDDMWGSKAMDNQGNTVGFYYHTQVGALVGDEIDQAAVNAA